MPPKNDRPAANATRSPTIRALARRRLLVTFGVFVLLGLPEGILGTAWPSIRTTFDRPVSSLASIITAYTVGYLISTLASGRLTEYFGNAHATSAGVTLTLIGLLGYVVAPVWLLFAISALLLGTGAGTVDSVINAEVALRYGQRTMHFLHAAFGVGATIGPLAVAMLLNAGASWRWSYGLLAVLEGTLLLLLLTLPEATSDTVQQQGHEAQQQGHEAQQQGHKAQQQGHKAQQQGHKAQQQGHKAQQQGHKAQRPSARQPELALAATLIYFMLYVGAEVSIGQWSYTFLTEQRNVSEELAGFAVAAYWGGLTVGRLTLGAIDDRLPPMQLLRASVLVSFVGACWFWSGLPASTWALPLVGLAFAGVFPSLVLLTPGWLGRDRVVRAVGYQLAASSGGAILASWAIGQLTENSLQAVPGSFVVLTAMLASAHLFTEFATRP